MIKKSLIIIGILILSIFIFKPFSTKDITGKAFEITPKNIEGISCSPASETEISAELEAIRGCERNKDVDCLLYHLEHTTFNEIKADIISGLGYVAINKVEESERIVRTLISILKSETTDLNKENAASSLWHIAYNNIQNELIFHMLAPIANSDFMGYNFKEGNKDNIISIIRMAIVKLPNEFFEDRDNFKILLNLACHARSESYLIELIADKFTASPYSNLEKQEIDCLIEKASSEELFIMPHVLRILNKFIFNENNVDTYLTADHVSNLLRLSMEERNVNLKAPFETFFSILKDKTSNQEILSILDSMSYNLNKKSIDVITRTSALSNADLETLKQRVLNELGVRPLKYFGYLNEITEVRLVDAILRASDQVSDNPHGISISPELLFTLSMMEGLNLWIDNSYYINPNSRVSGFDALGLDHFGSEVNTLKNLRLLRNDYDGYHITERTNERGEKVTSAVFDNIDLALEALAAEIAYRQYLFLQDAREAGYNINDFSEEEKIFWTYLYFNPGPTFAKRNLIQNKDYCCTNNVCCYWPGEQLSFSEAVRNAKYLSLQRVATYDWVKKTEVFA